MPLLQLFRLRSQKRKAKETENVSHMTQSFILCSNNIDRGIVSVFSVFQIVKFNNDACTAVDGTMGTCYTASECTTKGGEERGNCASGFGVCCVGESTYKINSSITLSIF